jgi:septal ring factor EnvC (AmiA/AmiB activator)
MLLVNPSCMQSNSSLILFIFVPIGLASLADKDRHEEQSKYADRLHALENRVEEQSKYADHLHDRLAEQSKHIADGGSGAAQFHASEKGAEEQSKDSAEFSSIIPLFQQADPIVLRCMVSGRSRRTHQWRAHRLAWRV